MHNDVCNHGMKSHAIAILLVWLLASGCVFSTLTMEKAGSKKEMRKIEGTERYETVVVQGEPAYYAVLPFAVVADIATLPIQVFLLVAWQSHGL
jgi:hypothetical protein